MKGTKRRATKARAAEQEPGEEKASTGLHGKHYVMIVAVGAVTIIVWLLFNREPDPCAQNVDSVACVCWRLLPNQADVGFTVTPSSKTGVEIGLGSKKATSVAATGEQVSGFISCVKLHGGAAQISGGEVFGLEMLGKIADLWKGSGVKVRLLPGSNDEALNNLAVGPAAGTRQELLTNWCSDEGLGKCIVCNPPEVTESTSEVVMELKPNAPVTKKQWDGKWPYPTTDPATNQPTFQLKAWELVEPSGKRFFYQCNGN